MSNLTSQRLTRNEQVETEQIDGEWIIFDTVKQSVTKLNALGGLIWSIIPEHQTTEELISYIKSEYKVEEDIVSTDVHSFVNELIQVGLLRYA